MERVVAKRPPTSTEALGAKSTPFGLVRKTWPLAVMRPKISDGLVPITRFSAMADELGWLKLTQALEPIEKLSHCRIALLVDWSICSLLGLYESVAAPAVTWPPVGSALALVCASAGLKKAHGNNAAPTAKASARGCVRSTRLVRAEPLAMLTFLRERVLRGLVRFVVAMVLSS